MSLYGLSIGYNVIFGHERRVLVSLHNSHYEAMKLSSIAIIWNGKSYPNYSNLICEFDKRVAYKLHIPWRNSHIIHSHSSYTLLAVNNGQVLTHYEKCKVLHAILESELFIKKEGCEQEKVLSYSTEETNNILRYNGCD
jgi:hypothetical protein